MTIEPSVCPLDGHRPCNGKQQPFLIIFDVRIYGPRPGGGRPRLACAEQKTFPGSGAWSSGLLTRRPLARVRIPGLPAFEGHQFFSPLYSLGP